MGDVFNVGNFIGIVEILVVVVHVVICHNNYFFVFCVCFVPFIYY